MNVSVKVDWLKGSDKALAEVGSKATQKNVLTRTLTKAAEPIKATMDALAPRDSGYTADSIAISPKLNPKQRRSAKQQGKGFAEVYVGTSRGSAAGLQEFGTVNQPARPYLRPAYEQTKQQALDIIATELWVEIRKAADRAARKRAKAGL